MRRAAALLLLVAGVGAARPALAGWYLMPEVLWTTYVHRPVANEDTTNLYGVGAQLSLGYSLWQGVDLGLFGGYLPGTPQYAKFGKGDATLVLYGGELGLRMAQSLYVGLRGGMAKYRLDNQTQAAELAGDWKGPGGGVALAAVTPVSKTAFIQASLEFSEYVLAMGTDTGTVKRKLDVFGLGIAYMWNRKGGEGTPSVQSTIFNDFLNSIVF